MKTIVIAVAALLAAAFALWRQARMVRPSRSGRIYLKMSNGPAPPPEIEPEIKAAPAAIPKPMLQALQPKPLLAGLTFCALLYAASVGVALMISHSHS